MIGLTNQEIDVTKCPEFTNFDMFRQALINGNFDVWQRGTTITDPNPNSKVFLADRWGIGRCGSSDTTVFPSITHSRQNTIPSELDDSYFFYRISPNGAGSSYSATAFYQLTQAIENGAKYLGGETVTLSFWARSSIAGKRLAFDVIQNYGTGGSPSASDIMAFTGSPITLTSTWTRYALTITLPTLNGKTFGTNNDDYLNIEFWLVWGSNFYSRTGASTPETFGGAGNIDIAQVQLNAGEIAPPFSPRRFDEELRLCMRYFEKSNDYKVSPGTVSDPGMACLEIGGLTTSLPISLTSPFKVAKRTNPTVNAYSPSTGGIGQIDARISSGWATGINAYSIQTIGTNSFILWSYTNSNYSGFKFHWTADAEI